MDDEFEEPRPPKREQLSKVPSWIMLGFALGVACVLVWPKAKQTPPVSKALPAFTNQRPAPAPPPTIERAKFFEAVFAEWSGRIGGNIWENDLTEVAFLSADGKSFSEKFEVLRSGEHFYFRSIAEFTRPKLTHGVPDDSPLQFTEPQAARDQWLRENSAESFRKFTGAAEPKKP